MFSHLDSGKLHHAYLVIGEHGATRAELAAFLAGVLGSPVEAHPDVHFLTYDFWSADETQEFRRLSAQSAIAGDRRFFVIATHAIYVPAQNMLLKTFEEPFAGHHFFLLMENERALLPTLLSRFQIVRAPESELTRTKKDKALAFLKASPAARVDMLKPFAKKTDDPEEKRAIKREAVKFVHDLEDVLHEMIPKNPRAAKALAEISRFEPYFTDSSVNMKFILEHLAGVI